MLSLGYLFFLALLILCSFLLGYFLGYDFGHEKGYSKAWWENKESGPE